MTPLLTMVGLAAFLGCFLIFLLLLRTSSAENALLKAVTQRPNQAAESASWSSWLTADQLAKPFTVFRGLFSREPNPELTRRLMLAGYRKPAHADIFIGARLAIPAFLGIVVALLVTDNTFFYFVLALVIGFFAPDFWLSRAINKRREEIKLALPDTLDLLSICMEAGLGLDQAIVRVGQSSASVIQRSVKSSCKLTSSNVPERNV